MFCVTHTKSGYLMWRNILGNFNVLTVSFVPALLSSYVAILLERPSRRGLLSLYVTNVASETLFRMASWRGLVRPLPYGEVIIFTTSIATLLFLYRSSHATSDSIYSLLRFVVGPFEEKGYAENREDLPSQDFSPRFDRRSPGVVKAALQVYKSLVRGVKNYGRHSACPHPFSCTFYTLQGAVKLFSLGYGLQACLRVLLQLKRVVRRPNLLPSLLVHKNALKLGAFLGGLSGIFRVNIIYVSLWFVSCLLRRVANKDSQYHAIPAGIFAGLAFSFFPDNTIALYVMWKSLQILYNDAVEKGYLPKLPGFTILLYSISTAILFHAAVLEPHNLRPSYWKFLFTISGGRISAMDRTSLDVFGLKSSQGLLEAVGRTSTVILPTSHFQ
uniref:Transmembrane protein 135 N-terminal domain-containing protein n=1 Tax=Timema bartmani TaxID=61472 RepID=A0A7R9EX19_9NEOP|nr:unnamed protein product [Timema bartmani]